MAEEVQNPITIEISSVFNSVDDIVKELSLNPEAFFYHVHVPVMEETHADALNLRNEFLAINSDKIKVSAVWNPQGPHSKYRYYSTYMPGSLREIVTNIIENKRGDASVMVHPVTGYEYAEHTQFAVWYGPAVTDALDNNFLKTIDRRKGLKYPGLE